MPKPLTREDVIDRLHIHASESYALIANVGKGIALGVGSLVLLQIASEIRSEWIRLLPWSASLAAVLLSYVKWTRGTLLSNARSNVWDSLFPLLMGIVEFVLFAILAVEKQLPFLWLNWPACLAAHALAAAGLVHNRIRLTDVRLDFDNDLFPLGGKFKSWLRADRFQAGLTGLIFLLVWILNRAWILPSYGTSKSAYFVSTFALLFLLFSWKPISDADSQRRQIDEFVSRDRPQARPAVA